MDLKELLRDNLQPFLKSSKATQQYNRLQQGKSINWAPKSDRYTYSNQFDTDYSKNWKPESKEEKETLTPSGYFRVGDRTDAKNTIMKDILNSAFRKAKAENPDATNAEIENEALKESSKVFDDEYKEKQISIPSTALNNIRYNPRTGGLYVKFQGGNKTYFYPNVPMKEVQDLMKAASKGEYFLKNIHDQYTLNKGHKRAGHSKVYGNMTAAQVGKFWNKYSKAYEKHNVNRMQKLARNANQKYKANMEKNQ